MREGFGGLADGREVERITLRGGGLTVRFLTLGAIVQDLRLDGVAHPLVLGAETAAAYLAPALWFGAMVGRFANRIGGARFSLDGQEFRTEANDRGNTLHGGSGSSGVSLWQLAEMSADHCRFTLDLPDGHMGFPGRLAVQLDCRLPGDGVLDFAVEARSDRAGPCSFAHHGYFNLDGSTDILDHRLQVLAESYLPVDDTLIPTGEIAAVAGTRFDFRQARPVRPGGYDHNFCTGSAAGPLRPVARLTGPQSGITLEVRSTEPGLQVYDGAHLDGVAGLGGRVYGRHAGMALETQAWPDAPNRPGFPAAVLEPGQVYRHHMQYRFAR